MPPAPTPPASKRRRVRLPGEDALNRLWCRAACAAASSGGFPPRPAAELERRRQVLRLRSYYEEQVRRVCGLAEAPRESFNRWLLARVNSPVARAAGEDPLLGGSDRRISPDDIVDSPLGSPASAASVLHSELMAALPLQLPYVEAADAQGNCMNLGKYALAVLDLLEEGSARKELRAACTAAVEWVDSRDRSSAEPAALAGEAVEKLAELRRSAQPLLEGKFHGAVRELCSDLEHAAKDAATTIAKESGSSGSDPSGCKVSLGFDRNRKAYLLSLSRDVLCDSHKTKANIEDEPEEMVEAVFTLSAECLNKLSEAYRQCERRATQAAAESGESSPMASVAKLLADPDSIWSLMFCLLCRYDALFGPGHKEGGGFHAALPPAAFDAIADKTGGPCVESFASPMLCRGQRWRYCSLFGDLDVFFGSLGSFLGEALAPELLGGCFEVNPPFLPAVVVQMVDKIIASLDRAQKAGVALQFVVVLPGLSKKGRCARPEFMPASIDRLFQSNYTRAVMGRRRRHFMYGCSFKTDSQWPSFAVHSRVVLMQTRVAAEGVGAEGGVPPLLACINRVWCGAQGADGDPDADDVVCEV